MVNIIILFSVTATPHIERINLDGILGILQFWEVARNTLFKDLIKAVPINLAFHRLWGHPDKWKSNHSKNSFCSASAWFNYFPPYINYESPAAILCSCSSHPNTEQLKGASWVLIRRILSWYSLDLHCWECLFSSQNSLSQLQRKWQEKKNTANTYQQLIPSTTAQLFVHGGISLFPFGAFTTENWSCTFRDTSCL